MRLLRSKKYAALVVPATLVASTLAGVAPAAADGVPTIRINEVSSNGAPETFPQDLSGLAFDPSNPDVLWASQNKLGTLFKLERNGDNTFIWAVTDDTHDGKTSVLKLDESGAFVVDAAYNRPAGMPNLNNEGMAIAPDSRCVDGRKEVLWSDDGDTDGHSLRRGSLDCTAPAQSQPTITAEVTSETPRLANGWYRSAVTITFTCETDGSDLTEPCPSPVVLGTTGADQSVTRTITAQDGGTATVTVDDLDIDVAPAPAPTVRGAAKVGLTLTSVVATAPVGATLTRQWLRDGKAIAGATKASYQLVRADAGRQVRVTVTRRWGAAVTASGTSAIQRIAAVNVSKPKVVGVAKVGRFLTAQRGTWAAPGHTYSYQWVRGGKAIKGATKARYRITRADVRKAIYVRVTVRKAGHPAVTAASKSVRPRR